MKKIILFFLLIYSSISYSQYYIDAELHLLDGTVKTGLAHINISNDKIKFKKNKEAKRISYNHKNIAKLILKKDSIQKEFRYKKAKGRRAPRLLELILEHKNVSLYAQVIEAQLYGLIGALLKVPNKFTFTYYIVKKEGIDAIYFGDTDLTGHKRFKETTKKHLIGCPELIGKIKNRGYKIEDAPKIVSHYNEKCYKN